MRLTKAVRIGGRLALLAGFVVVNLASGSTLGYFYGYSTPSMTGWMPTDSLSTQNVSFVTQPAMVSQSPTVTYSGGGWGLSAPSASSSTTGLSGWAGSSSGMASSAPVAAPTVYTAPAYTNWSPTAFTAASSPTTSAPTPYASTGGGSASGYSGWGLAPPATSSSSGSTSAANQQWGGWLNVINSTVPAVSSNITSPVTNPSTGTLWNLPTTKIALDPTATPEPSTIVLIGAGLTGLAVLRRRLA